VQLTLSKGPQPVELPTTLVGMTLADAKTALQGVGLDLGQHPADYSDTVVKGAIISVTTQGAQPPGTKVDVVVSKGPTPVAIPDESGKSSSDAQADLKAKNFTNVSTIEDYSDSVDKGKVISQTPKLPATAQLSVAVTLVISKGAQLFAVPNLFGMTVTEAKNALAKVGMDAKVIDIRGGSNEHVLSQDPVKDVQRPHGTVVTIRIF
jgi:serine/threonine-protein kinase